MLPTSTHRSQRTPAGAAVLFGCTNSFLQYISLAAVVVTFLFRVKVLVSTRMTWPGEV